MEEKDVRQPSTPIQKNTKNWLVLFVVIIIVVSIVVTLFLSMFPFKSDEIKINSIMYEPQNPVPGENITITVFVENCSSCGLNYKALFKGGGGTGSMFRINENEYQMEIGPFFNSTEIWFVVSAKSYNGTTIISDDYIVQVGSLERSEITAIEISNISYIPETPTTQNNHFNTIQTIANVTSNSTITDVYMNYMFFYPKSSAGGGGGCTMHYLSGNLYSAGIAIGEIPIGDYIGKEVPAGTIVLFKISAQDLSGNTVISSTVSFEIIEVNTI